MDRQSSFADMANKDVDFEKYLERELGKLAEMKAQDTAKTSTTASTSTAQPETRPASPPKPAALSAFPPKPKTGGLVLAVPPSPPSKDSSSPSSSSPSSATSTSTSPPPTAPPTAPLPPPPAATPGSPPRYQPAKPLPLRVSMLQDFRPTTSSTKRLSFSSLSTSRRPIKYGTGKHVGVELVPQPSDDAEDPLNWPAHKKEMHYATLLLMTALVSVMKTALLPVHSQISMGYAVSYTAAAALTGVPLMLSACSGAVCLVASRIWGKRPLYLASTLVLFIGTMWAITVSHHTFAQAMVARVFQGLGWGAFDVLVLGSVHDTYFEHERVARTAAVDVVAVACLWGGPLLGGVVSTATNGSIDFGRQFAVLGGFLVVAAFAVVLAAPETTYDRSFYSINTPAPPSSAWSNKSLPLRPHNKFSKDMVLSYLKSDDLRPLSYKANTLTDLAVLLQVPRAMVAPTTVLLTLVTLLPFCALWGMSASLSLLFAPLPFDLSPRSLGALFTGPWLMATLVVVVTSGGLTAIAGLSTVTTLFNKMGVTWPSSWKRLFSTTQHNLLAMAAGSLLVFVGLLAVGLYIASCSSLAAAHAATTHESTFAIPSTPPLLRFPAVSFLLGLLSVGAYLTNATVLPMVRRSAQFTSSNLALTQRNTVDMAGGVVVWRTLVAGAFVMGLPNAVWFYTLLKAASVGMVVAQVLVAAVVGLVWWRYDEAVRRLDGQVMRSVDLGMLKRAGSFFETD
ncbi:hypothetical protein SBRCBS47491_002120 [Sporothrix bragantina]|uniref:Major facilitator superfamily transporter n=1 Tax=Sporothrix bragantina TaxID=671064 RepID=A0ABP0B523_9PEZI